MPGQRHSTEKTPKKLGAGWGARQQGSIKLTKPPHSALAVVWDGAARRGGALGVIRSEASRVGGMRRSGRATSARQRGGRRAPGDEAGDERRPAGRVPLLDGKLMLLCGGSPGVGVRQGARVPARAQQRLRRRLVHSRGLGAGSCTAGAQQLARRNKGLGPKLARKRRARTLARVPRGSSGVGSRGATSSGIGPRAGAFNTNKRRDRRSRRDRCCCRRPSGSYARCPRRSPKDR